MNYQVLEDIILELSRKTTELSSEDVRQDFLATDFIKKVIDISTNTLKQLKNFCKTNTNKSIDKYLAREFDLLMANNQTTTKLAIDYANGNKKVDVPLNVNLSYNQAKNKTEDFIFVYDSLLASIKTETDRKAKDTALSELYDLKFHLSNIQDRLENYNNKIDDAF